MSLAPISSVVVPPPGMMLLAAMKCVLSASWIWQTNDHLRSQFETMSWECRDCRHILCRWNWCNCLPLRLNVYWTFLQRTFQRLINIQQSSKHFIFPVINITIHFDINDRGGCQKAIRAINAGCLHQSNDWQFITNASNKIQKKSKKSKEKEK